MSFKNYFFSALAALALFACNNDNIPVDETVSIKGGDLKIKVDLLEISKSTKSADDYVQNHAKSSIQTADLYLLQGSGADQTINSVTSLDQAGIDSLVNKGYMITKINNDITGVAIVANKKAGNLVAAVGSKLSDLENVALACGIADIQPDLTNKGVKNAPMFGSDGISDTGSTNPNTGNKLYKAEVLIKPVISRVQVYGKIQNSEKAQDLKVVRIFLDNFETAKPAKTLFTVNQSTNLDELLKPYPFFDKGADLQDKVVKTDGVYAYHIFPQTPLDGIDKQKDRGIKLILQVEYKDINGKPRTEYPTLRLATTVAGDDNKLSDKALDIEAAYIYTVNLGKIDWTGNGEYVDPELPENKDKEDKDDFEPGDGGDTPNVDQKDLKVIAIIQEWTEVDVVPSN